MREERGLKPFGEVLVIHYCTFSVPFSVINAHTPFPRSRRSIQEIMWYSTTLPVASNISVGASLWSLKGTSKTTFLIVIFLLLQGIGVYLHLWQIFTFCNISISSGPFLRGSCDTGNNSGGISRNAGGLLWVSHPTVYISLIIRYRNFQTGRNICQRVLGGE